MVDFQDIDLVSDHPWRLCVSYALTHIRVPGDKVKARTLSMHRLLMDCPEGMEIDHINRDGLDNRRANLRLATRSQQRMNEKMHVNNTSGHRGVSWNKRRHKWFAQIRCNYKQHNIGLFDDLDEAVRAYEAKSIELFGEFKRQGVK
jgi:hypothetical protein